MSSWETSTSDEQSVTVPVPITGKIRAYSSDALHVTMRGRSGTSVDFAQLPSGARTSRFRLAVTQRGKDEAGVWHDLETTWYTVKAWNQLAENCARSVFKGHPVIVSGRLKVNQWENSETGARGTELVIVASSIGHDLTHGLTRFFKLRDETPQAPAPGTQPSDDEPAAKTQSPSPTEPAATAVAVQPPTLASTGSEELASTQSKAPF